MESTFRELLRTWSSYVRGVDDGSCPVLHIFARFTKSHNRLRPLEDLGHGSAGCFVVICINSLESDILSAFQFTKNPSSCSFVEKCQDIVGEIQKC